MKLKITIILLLSLSFKASGQSKTELKPVDFEKILLLHTKEEYYDLDMFLREYGFKIVDIENNDIKRSYERFLEENISYELLNLIEIEASDSLTVKIVSMDYTSINYHKSLTEELAIYKYIKKNVNNGLFLNNVIGNEYNLNFLILFNGVRTNVDEGFVVGGYMFLTDDNKILEFPLDKWGPDKH